jgi:hypothetical protein
VKGFRGFSVGIRRNLGNVASGGLPCKTKPNSVSMYVYNLQESHDSKLRFRIKKRSFLSGLRPKHETVFVLSIFIADDGGGGVRALLVREVQCMAH